MWQITITGNGEPTDPGNSVEHQAELFGGNLLISGCTDVHILFGDVEALPNLISPPNPELPPRG